MNDFKTVFEEMKLHGMKMPVKAPLIRIDGAGQIFENCFKYFLDGSDYVRLEIYNEVVKWLTNNENRGLFLYGDCGLGKSFIARYVIPAILLKYKRLVVRCYDAQEMNKNIDEILDKPIITLDDIGTEDIAISYGNKRVAFAEIMDSAEKYGKLIIVSTNLQNEAEIKNRYGERVFERIISTTKRIRFSGSSLRR